MSGAKSAESSSAVGPWEPEELLVVIGSDQARLSRGFLRSRPEKWFPGLATQWLPLVHSLGIDIRPTEVKPLLFIPDGVEGLVAGTIDDEPATIVIDEHSSQTLLEAICPGIGAAVLSSEEGAAAAVVMREYLGRRLLTSFGLAWTGPQPSIVRCDPDLNPLDCNIAGAIRFTVAVNSKPVTMWLGLGRQMIERLDGLWRRQLLSSTRIPDRPLEIGFEVAQLSVAPSMLADYTRQGSVIDLEVLASDAIVLRQGAKAWLAAKMRAVEGRFAIETIPGPAPSPMLPSGTTRLSIQLGQTTIDPPTAIELGQPGAIIETDIPLGDRVSLVINNEQIAEARLCTYEGRFAISVL